MKFFPWKEIFKARQSHPRMGTQWSSSPSLCRMGSSEEAVGFSNTDSRQSSVEVWAQKFRTPPIYPFHPLLRVEAYIWKHTWFFRGILALISFLPHKSLSTNMNVDFGGYCRQAGTEKVVRCDGHLFHTTIWYLSPHPASPYLILYPASQSLNFLKIRDK